MRGVTLLTLALLLIGCSSDKLPTQANPEDSSQIMPLAVGNKWTYMNIEYDYSSVGYIGHDTCEYTIEIIGDTLIDGRTWYMAKTVICSVDGNRVHTSFMTNRQDGLWSGYFDDGSFVSHLYIKYPAEKHETYHITYSNESFNTTAEVFEIDVQREFQSDTVTCQGIIFTNDLSDQISSICYYSPGIGKVMQEVWNISIGTFGDNSYRPPDRRRYLLSFDKPN